MPEIERHRRLRASDADRDAVLTILHEAYVAGRLDLDDLTHRQEQALAARYIDQLPELVADVPEGHALDGRWLRPTRRRAKARPSCDWSASKAFDALILIANSAFCISASTRFDLKLL